MEANELKELTQPPEDKKPFFFRFINFFGSKLKRKKEDVQNISKFEELINTVDPKDPIYETVKKVAKLCDTAISLAKEKLMVESKLAIINSELQEISYYETLTDDDIDHLKELLERYMALSRDRTAMRYQISGFDKALEKMGPLEEDAKFIEKNVLDAEKKQRYFKHDLMHLEGEKVALVYERENLLNMQYFTHKFSISLVALFGMSALGITLYSLFFNADMFIPLAIMCTMLVFIVPGLYYLQNRIRKELSLNLRRHHRAVQLFNKKIVVYSHYTRFLKYVYKKYDVTGSDKLTQNIKDYAHYKHILTRFDAIGNSLRHTEDQINFFIKENKIQNSAATIESFAKTVNIEDKQRYFWDLKKEQTRLKNRNKELEQNHNNIWNDLVLLNEDDKKSKIIDFIIQRYIEEVGKLVQNVKLEEQADLKENLQHDYEEENTPNNKFNFDVTARN